MLDEHTAFGNLEIFEGLRIWTLQITKGFSGRKKLFWWIPSPLKIINSLLKQERPYAFLNRKYLVTIC